jgi:hypothetical protein
VRAAFAIGHWYAPVRHDVRQLVHLHGQYPSLEYTADLPCMTPAPQTHVIPESAFQNGWGCRGSQNEDIEMVAIALTYLCGFGDAARMRGLSIVLLLP